MAKLTIVPAKVELPPPTYLLELTQEEAETLSTLVRTGVVGSSTKSRRMHTDAIGNALQAACVRVSYDLDGAPVRFLDIY